MAGFNYTYLICAKFEKPVDGVFLNYLKKEFLEILDEELRQWIDIYYEVEKDLPRYLYTHKNR